MSIQDVINWTQDQILATPTAHVKRAPYYPDNLRLAVITAITWADNIHLFCQGAEFDQTVFDMKIQIVAPLANLPDVGQLFDGVPMAVANIFRPNPNMSGHCVTYDKDVNAKRIVGAVNGVECTGYEFVVGAIKLNE